LVSKRKGKKNFAFASKNQMGAALEGKCNRFLICLAGIFSARNIKMKNAKWPFSLSWNSRPQSVVPAGVETEAVHAKTIRLRRTYFKQVLQQNEILGIWRWEKFVKKNKGEKKREKGGEREREICRERERGRKKERKRKERKEGRKEGRKEEIEKERGRQ
jgi:hypothetical protein